MIKPTEEHAWDVFATDAFLVVVVAGDIDDMGAMVLTMMLMILMMMLMTMLMLMLRLMMQSIMLSC